jgi:hypothetical protein
MSLSAEHMLGVIRKRYDYDRTTGIFTWKIRYLRHRPGDQIGSKNSKGYLLVSIFDKSYRLHRLAYLCAHKKWPDQIDHINGDKTDNRIENLRNCTVQENNFNKESTGGKSKYKGVYLEKARNLWCASICASGKRSYLGRFKTEKEAALAYNVKAIELHGEFAYLNEVSK